MSSMTKTACNAMVNFIFGNAEGFQSPTRLKLALFTNNPDEDEPIEVPSSAAYGYSRQDIKFSLSKDGKAYNTETITFPAAKKSWGVIRAIGVYGNIYASEGDGNTGEVDELLFYASLPNQKEIPANAVLAFSPGNIRYSLVV